MSCNLISGMYQRLDTLRKGAFASACIFGEDNNNTISGIWIWRGQDLVFTVRFVPILHKYVRYVLRFKKIYTHIFIFIAKSRLAS